MSLQQLFYSSLVQLELVCVSIRTDLSQPYSSTIVNSRADVIPLVSFSGIISQADCLVKVSAFTVNRILEIDSMQFVDVESSRIQFSTLVDITINCITVLCNYAVELWKILSLATTFGLIRGCLCRMCSLLAAWLLINSGNLRPH